MFAKVFAQIFDSSISEDYISRHVFMDLLVLADREGIVDMTLTAISRRTNVPVEVIEQAIQKLLLPDPTSRSDSHEGCRIAPLDNHRDWGWYIVNFSKYRDMRDEEARKSYFREYQRTRRAKDRAVKDRVLTGVDKSDKVELLNDVTYTEVEVISDVDAKDKNIGEKVPDWIPLESWNGWLEVRRVKKDKNGKKIPWTPHIAKINLGKLEKWRGQGYNLTVILEAAAAGNWQGLYLPKDDHGQEIQPERRWVEGDPNNPADWEAAIVPGWNGHQ